MEIFCKLDLTDGRIITNVLALVGSTLYISKLLVINE